MQKDTYQYEDYRQNGVISLQVTRLVAALLLAVLAFLATPASAVDWSGFYAGFNMGLGRGMETSLETSAHAEERKTVEWCLNEASDKQVPGLDAAEDCAKPDAVSWTGPDCPDGGTLQGDQCVVPDGDPTDPEFSCPDGYSLEDDLCVADTGVPAECGKDLKLDGNLCVGEETAKPYCENNKQKVDDDISDPAKACVKSGTTAAQVLCDPDYKLSASSPWTCTQKIEEDATCPRNGNLDYIGPKDGECFATAKTEPVCPAGSDLKGGKCIVTGKQYNPTAGFCTVGGKKMNGLTKELCTAEF